MCTSSCCAGAWLSSACCTYHSLMVSIWSPYGVGGFHGLHMEYCINCDKIEILTMKYVWMWIPYTSVVLTCFSAWKSHCYGTAHTMTFTCALSLCPLLLTSIDLEWNVWQARCNQTTWILDSCASHTDSLAMVHCRIL